jgi:pimeloyl-ACP methyl ester carboxylesterase
VISYDRRGYARTGGEPVRLIATHTAAAAAILECLQAAPVVVVGTSAGATIAVDLAVGRPDLVQAVIAHEAAWRASRHLPNTSQLAVTAKIGWQALRGRYSDAVETLLRAAYSYRDGGTAWDAFPEEWRRIARENARPALLDFRKLHRQLSISGRSRQCYGPRRLQLRRPQPRSIIRLTRSLAAPVPPPQRRKLKAPATPPSSMQHPTSCS